MISIFPYGAALVAGLLVLFSALALRSITVAKVDYIVISETDSKKKSRRYFETVIDRIGFRAQRGLAFLYPLSRRRFLARALDAAGHPEGLTTTLFIQRHSGFIVIGLAIAIIFFFQGNTLIAVVFGLGLAEWMWVWILLMAKDRRAVIESTLPDFLDVLRITVSSGMSFRKSLQTVAEFYEGPLADEISRALYEMGVGVSRRDALVALRDRVPLEAMDAFVTAVLQAEELGAQLTDVLAAISLEVRRNRAAEVRRHAQRATGKVSLISTVVVVPGAVILIFGALFLPILQNGGLSAVIG